MEKRYNYVQALAEQRETLKKALKDNPDTSHGKKITGRNKLKKGIDFDVTMAWYGCGYGPSRHWPASERVEDQLTNM
jgi:hypothetical protein